MNKSIVSADKQYCIKATFISVNFLKVYVGYIDYRPSGFSSSYSIQIVGRHDSFLSFFKNMVESVPLERKMQTHFLRKTPHSIPSGRHLPDKAIDLVDEACANVRVQLDSQPEEIDNLERKRIQLEVELHALEKEKDKASKARLVEVSSHALFQCLTFSNLYVLFN